MPRLQPFAPDLWLADGTPITAALGFRYPIRMAVLRLGSGGLVLWSPVQAEPDLRDEIAALGPVEAIVAPNALHHVFLGEWVEAFPQAALYAAPKLRAKRPDLSFAAELPDQTPAHWEGQLDAVLVPNSIAPEVVLFHPASGTVLTADLLQNMPADWYHGWRALIARLDHMTGPLPGVPVKFRLAMRNDVARAGLRRLLDWPAERVVMAHGTPVAEGGRAYLAGVFGPMLR
ncbi:DUF4336 domain-containing protein [Pararhodobacter zhoushanensis]|uniref:DUF4336 domain-containing protein n=1 Tax=Pararhodobacter zhoushanensis TaxID=2479545 RepID=UPI000F8DD7E0|nr:DUF4336 domain-containing protein [Pararhodobacter zhoushanensis]